MKLKREHIIAIAIIAIGIIISQFVYTNWRINKQEAKEIAVIEAREKANEKERLNKQLEESTRKINIDNCIAEAEDAYWSYMELNGTGKRYDEDGVWALQRFWDTAEKNKKTAIDLCFKRY